MFNLPSANLNRRRLLLGLASASAAGAAIVATGAAVGAAIVAAREGEALLILGDALPDVVAEHVAAEAAYWAVVKEWEPKWPTAPDALAVRSFDSRRLERGLRGYAIRPDGTYDGYVKGQLSQARSIETSADILRHINTIDGYLRRLRPKHPLTAEQLELPSAERAELVKRLALAGQYENAKRQTLKASGYPAADERQNAASAAMTALAGKIMAETPTTMTGVLIQAEALEAFGRLRLAPFETAAWGWPRLFAANLLRIAREAPAQQA